MLDENLPTFIVGGPSERSKHDATISYTQFGQELTPAYTLRKPDPSLPGSKNRYAAALYDSFNPEILFAEVLLIPEWTHPTLSAEQIRLNGGVPPPPEPILPTEVTIQLYNPDQQVVIRQKKTGTFSSTPTWYFDIPQQTFRQPSSSSLDRTQSDPAASDTTPKIEFKWKRDGKLSKDLVCFLSGKTTNPDGTKKRNKEPDITIAIFQHLREITLYEPNLQRVEIEDPKGFEVILLLGAVAIRDIYFSRMVEAFNISEPPRLNTGGDAGVANASGSRPAGPSKTQTLPIRPPVNGAGPRPSSSPPSVAAAAAVGRPARVPPTDPRSQWEIDAETARLRKQAEAEEKERRAREAAEQKQIRKMLEAEEKEKRRRQAEVDKETERLKRLYGKEEAQAAALLRPPPPPRNQRPQSFSAPSMPTIPQHGAYQHQHTHSSSHQYHPQQPSAPPNWAPPPGTFQPYIGGPYLHGGAAPAASQSGFFLGPPGTASGGGSNPSRLKEKKSSFFGLRRDLQDPSAGGSGPQQRLKKKGSSIF